MELCFIIGNIYASCFISDYYALFMDACHVRNFQDLIKPFQKSVPYTRGMFATNWNQ